MRMAQNPEYIIEEEDLPNELVQLPAVPRIEATFEGEIAFQMVSLGETGEFTETVALLNGDSFGRLLWEELNTKEGELPAWESDQTNLGRVRVTIEQLEANDE